MRLEYVSESHHCYCSTPASQCTAKLSFKNIQEKKPFPGLLALRTLLSEAARAGVQCGRVGLTVARYVNNVMQC